MRMLWVRMLQMGITITEDAEGKDAVEKML